MSPVYYVLLQLYLTGITAVILIMHRHMHTQADTIHVHEVYMCVWLSSLCIYYMHTELLGHLIGYTLYT